MREPQTRAGRYLSDAAGKEMELEVVAVEVEAAQQERERLDAEWSRYWEMLVTTAVYGNGGGWGEAVLLKVASMLHPPAEPE